MPYTCVYCFMGGSETVNEENPKSTIRLILRVPGTAGLMFPPKGAKETIYSLFGNYVHAL